MPQTNSPATSIFISVHSAESPVGKWIWALLFITAVRYCFVQCREKLTSLIFEPAAFIFLSPLCDEKSAQQSRHHADQCGCGMSVIIITVHCVYTCLFRIDLFVHSTTKEQLMCRYLCISKINKVACVIKLKWGRCAFT